MKGIYEYCRKNEKKDDQKIEQEKKKTDTQRTVLAKISPSLFFAPKKWSFDLIVYFTFDGVRNDHDHIDQCRGNNDEFKRCFNDDDSSDDVSDRIFFLYVVCEPNVSI